MPIYLRQATAGQVRTIGPFHDENDYKTPETALSIANTDIKLIQGGVSSNKNSGGATHVVNGEYTLTFDAVDSATVGEIELSVIVAGALPVFDRILVLEEAVYDAHHTAGALGYVASQVVASVTGNVSGSVGSIAPGGIAANSFAAGAVDAAALNATAVDEILDEQIGDSTVTVRQALKLMVAALGGKLAGAATTTVTIRNVADDTNVVTATVDANGNRTAVSLSL